MAKGNAAQQASEESQRGGHSDLKKEKEKQANWKKKSTIAMETVEKCV